MADKSKSQEFITKFRSFEHRTSNVDDYRKLDMLLEDTTDIQLMKISKDDIVELGVDKIYRKLKWEIIHNASKGNFFTVFKKVNPKIIYAALNILKSEGDYIINTNEYTEDKTDSIDLYISISW
jgi:hypothetical protein